MLRTRYASLRHHGSRGIADDLALWTSTSANHPLEASAASRGSAAFALRGVCLSLGLCAAFAPLAVAAQDDLEGCLAPHPRVERALAHFGSAKRASELTHRARLRAYLPRVSMGGHFGNGLNWNQAVDLLGESLRLRGGRNYSFNVRLTFDLASAALSPHELAARRLRAAQMQAQEVRTQQVYKRYAAWRAACCEARDAGTSPALVRLTVELALLLNLPASELSCGPARTALAQRSPTQH